MLLLLVLPLTLWLLWSFLRPRKAHALHSVAVLVLGDVGRSPRMMYHAESFAENEFQTYVIGYRGSRPIPALERLPLIELRYLPELPSMFRLLPFILHGPLKVIHQTISIFLELLVNLPVSPEFILVQNPPSIPPLVVVWAIARIRGCKTIIDWHNLGYSILALKLGDRHLFVRAYRWLESTFGRSAFAHLFVTRALHDYLAKEWHLRGKKIILHDRPPRHFHKATPQETHELFMRLHSELSSLEAFLPVSNLPFSTPLTDTENPPPSGRSTLPTAAVSSIPLTSEKYAEISPPALRPDRPALVVSSTSWTPDEDFGILLEALKEYDETAEKWNAQNSTFKLPKILMLITGKGDKEAYMSQVDALQRDWKFVRCLSLWLEATDYPILLGSADIGISLHTSSSQMDLPMKVVDMFGCGLPVCALKFGCLDELVINGFNGLVFQNAEQLCEHLVNLLKSFPDSTTLSSLASNIRSAAHNSPSSYQQYHDVTWQWGTWSENWNQAMRPLILRDWNRE